MGRFRTSYLLFTLILLFTAACDDHGHQHTKIYIPDGYVGWVRIEYGVWWAPRLERDFFGPGEYWRFPPSGLLQTSSRLSGGEFVPDGYYYYSENGTESLEPDMINGGIIGWCAKTPDGSYLERNFKTFFVGPKHEYEKREHELEQFRKGDCEYVLNSLADLPKPGNQR